ncbi:MAG TPA: cell division protein FtsA [Firmicutes bacterium]|nr:cell division protein FtsA [Bacillota bacterium]
MTRRDVITGIDIGTTNVRVLVGEIMTDGNVNIIGVGTSPSEGIKKGSIIDLERTVDSITRATDEAERMVGAKIESVNVGIVGTHIGLINNRGVVAVSRDDKEITELDVERVLQAARVVALPQEKEIIDVIPKEFIVDGYDGIRDPVGMLGVRLEVDAMVLTGTITSMRNLMRCINMAGFEVNALVLNSLANGDICLSKDEKELGVFLIDLGGGTTEISYYQQGGLEDIAVLPIGGDHITNDLAVGLRTTFLLAEKIKLEHGFAIWDGELVKEDIEIEGISGKEVRNISSDDLFAFIEPRITEIVQLCAQEINRMSSGKLPPGGVVLTGGVSLMRGITELAESIFGCTVRLAQPEYLGVKSPIYSTAVGMIHYVSRNKVTRKIGKKPEKKEGFFFNIWKRIKSFLADIWE